MDRAASFPSYDAGDPFFECRRRREQRDDEVAVAREVEKIPWMDDHIVLFQRPKREFFVTFELRNANDGRPAALDRQELCVRTAGEQTFERVERVADPSLYRVADACS